MSLIRNLPFLFQQHKNDFLNLNENKDIVLDNVYLKNIIIYTIMYLYNRASLNTTEHSDVDVYSLAEECLPSFDLDVIENALLIGNREDINMFLDTIYNTYGNRVLKYLELDNINFFVFDIMIINDNFIIYLDEYPIEEN